MKLLDNKSNGNLFYVNVTTHIFRRDRFNIYLFIYESIVLEWVSLLILVVDKKLAPDTVKVIK